MRRSRASTAVHGYASGPAALLSLVLLIQLPSVTAAAEPETVLERAPLGEKDLLEDDDYEVRLSLPTAEDHEAWSEPGLRVQLGYGRGVLRGTGLAPDLSVHHMILRPLVRLDRWWSIAASLTYSIAGGGLAGLRWATTIEPILHPAAGLGIAFGVGYSGIMGERTSDDHGSDYDSGHGPGYEDQRLTHTRQAEANERLSACEGSGWTVLARLDYLFVVGQLFATGPFVHTDVQWVLCNDADEGLHPETGQPTALQSWWRHQGWSAGWWATWR